MENTFTTGSQAIYGLHGRCQILGIEEKLIGNETIAFYKVELAKPPIGKSKKSEAAIWIPVKNANQVGLRSASNSEQAAAALKILSSREYYLNINESMKNITRQIEDLVRNEGVIGLAKAYSYLFVRKSREAICPTDLTRMIENTQRILFRELAEALNQPQKDLEAQIAKSIRVKLQPDN